MSGTEPTQEFNVHRFIRPPGTPLNLVLVLECGAVIQATNSYPDDDKSIEPVTIKEALDSGTPHVTLVKIRSFLGLPDRPELIASATLTAPTDQIATVVDGEYPRRDQETLFRSIWRTVEEQQTMELNALRAQHNERITSLRQKSTRGGSFYGTLFGAFAVGTAWLAAEGQYGYAVISGAATGLVGFYNYIIQKPEAGFVQSNTEESRAEIERVASNLSMLNLLSYCTIKNEPIEVATDPNA